MKRLFLVALVILGMVSLASAQSNTKNCRGIVIDELGEPVVGATVQAVGTTIATATDIDGKFDLKVPTNTKELKISYIGYKTLTLKAEPEMGEIKIVPDSKMLQDVIVTSSVAKTRETPVAMADISAGEIEVMLGAKEFPEVLNSTPGVYATPTGGGYGDAKINMRGFKSPNVAVLVNGVPMNDMEWGGIYWSNFDGLNTVTSHLQTQRGLGAAIISVPSIGGTVSITTKGLDAKKGGSVWYGMGNNGKNDIGISLSTGMLPHGWAINVLGGRTWGNGYIQGTPYEAWNYFVNISKKIGEKHQLSLNAYGAPQWHDKRPSSASNSGLSIEGWQEAENFNNGGNRYTYNPVFGYDNEGQVRTSQKNIYHKPIISLGHIWQINEYSSLSSSIYTSLASGGGYAGEARGDYSYNDWNGARYGVLSTKFRRPDGTFDYGAIQDMNAESTTGSNMIMSMSDNSHQWYGLISNYKNEIIPNKFTFTVGLDLRYYIGHHKNTIIDLYGGKYFMDDADRGNVDASLNSAAADPNWKYEKLGVGDIVYRNYDGFTDQEGVYGQGEWKFLDGKINAILAGSLNVTTYQRKEMFYADADHAWSKRKSFLAGTIKGGLNWNIDHNNNVYFNGGYLTKAPFFSYGVFTSSQLSNTMNTNPKDEKIGSIEIGYGYHSPKFSLAFNAYYTMWWDMTNSGTTKRGSLGDQSGSYVLNLRNVKERHMGLEVNFTYIPTNWFELNGMLSWGDWQWDNNPSGYFYNERGEPLASLEKNEITTDGAPNHLKGQIMQKGIKIGDSAQTTGNLGVTFRPFKGFRIGATWQVYARLYSDYTINASNLDPSKPLEVKQPWLVPWGNQIDLNASYRFKLGALDATIYGNVHNLCNNFYIRDAMTNFNEDGIWQNAYNVFYSFGRTYSIKLKVNF